MLRILDTWLDRITMYRLLLYYLIALVVAAAGLSVAGDLHFSALRIVFSALYLIAVCWLSNHVFAAVWRAPANRDSSLITALILSLIITPPTTAAGVLFLTAAGGLAMASKYLLTIRRQHIFNPAALAVVLTSFGAGQSATWWIGSAPMLPFVVAGGLLLARKIRRLQMVATFIVTSLVANVVYTLLAHQSVHTSLHTMLLSSSLFFLAFVMLTEPLTSPGRLNKQCWYGALVGLVFPPQVHLLGVYSTPELALIIGNFFSYIIAPRFRLLPLLVHKEQITPTTADFIFEPDRHLNYQPGQYMEWTLPHEHADQRGERRYFTLASSPTEPTLRLGVKFYKDGSSYKHKLLKVTNKTPIAAGQLSGDFVMPSNPNIKLVFIAGGIGVTPFRSMVKYLIDNDEQRTITILYAAANPQEFAYKDVFEAGRHKLGIETLYVSSDPRIARLGPHYHHGALHAELIQQAVPDHLERTFYISGPHPMVQATVDVLLSLNVPRHQIKIDFFPGYA